jgi:hypothetical protein
MLGVTNHTLLQETFLWARHLCHICPTGQGLKIAKQAGAATRS